MSKSNPFRTTNLTTLDIMADGWLVGGRPGEYAMSQKQDSFTPEENTRNKEEEETEGKELGLGES